MFELKFSKFKSNTKTYNIAHATHVELVSVNVTRITLNNARPNQNRIYTIQFIRIRKTH